MVRIFKYVRNAATYFGVRKNRPEEPFFLDSRKFERVDFTVLRLA